MPWLRKCWGRQTVPMFSNIEKKWHFFFQRCLRNPSAKDETVKLYRRPRYFMHPAWMRVSGLIWEEHICATCVYDGRLLCSLLSSVKPCADVQVSLIWIQLNAECLLVPEGGCWDWGAPRHKKSDLQRILLVRKLWRDIYRMPKLCPVKHGGSTW